MSFTTTEQLAVHGGSALAPDLKAPVWPPRSQETADRLSELYLKRDWSFAGDEEIAFAQEFASYQGARHGIFMANGTVTLQCALQAYGIGPGDEVIVPALTWIATAMAAIEVGATPVFVDVEPTTLCLDPGKLQEALTPRTRAIIPVHLFGGMADLDATLEIARRHELIVIEDCAHGHGGRWNAKGLGSSGHIGSFSFQQSKTMASGEGGICITNDDTIAERLYRLKHIGYGPSTMQGKAGVAPDADLRCHNYRATEFQAVILRDQLQALPQRIARYQESASLLDDLLADVAGVRVQSRGRCATTQSYYCWCITMTGEMTEIPLVNVERALRAEGMAIGGTYGPVYNHTLWNIPNHLYRLPEQGCPVAETVGTLQTLAMPHYWLGADDETIETIARIITKVVSNVDELKAAHQESTV